MLVQSFWHGGALTPYEFLCIRSFLDHGHQYHLYTYDATLEVPRGARRCDAASILPQDRVFVLRSGVGRGSVSIFADLFRYELLLRHGGWWVDTDIVCLVPVLPDSELFFACEAPGRVNCAVMCFPPGHAVIRACRDEAARLGADVLWGATGPRLVTAVLTQHGLLDQAAGPETCYPFNWNEVPLLYDPAHTAELVDRTRGAVVIHLWNEMARRAGIAKTVGVPEGCYLDTLFRAHQIPFPPCPRYSPADIVRLDENRIAVDKLVAAENRLARLEAQLADNARREPAKRKPRGLLGLLSRLGSGRS